VDQTLEVQGALKSKDFPVEACKVFPADWRCALSQEHGEFQFMLRMWASGFLEACSYRVCNVTMCMGFS
jgi:hypothetical protein